MKCGRPSRSCPNTCPSEPTWRSIRITPEISRPRSERSKRSQEPTDLAMLALAFARLGQGQLAEATDTYQKLATMDARGASWSASGLGDLALYEGRFSDAVADFRAGAATDLAAKNNDTGGHESSPRLLTRISCEGRRARPLQPPRRRC